MQRASRSSRRLLAFSSAAALAAVAIAAFSTGSSAHPIARHGLKIIRHAHKSAAESGGFSITSVPWGSVTVGVPTPQEATLYTLTNENGMTVKITNYGGIVQSIWVPDRKGDLKNVALGFSTLQDYVNDFTQGFTKTPWPLPGGSGDTFFGAIIGRYANRIANASFDLNGKTYTLDANNGTNTLHGGFLGWNTQVWTATPETGPDWVALKLTHDFPAGEGCVPSLSPGCTGFPAPVTATVTYILTKHNALKIKYSVLNTSTTDATVINLTNHTYFNLGGEGSGTVENQLLQINADKYQPVDTNLIPTGFASVEDTAFDFLSLKPIGQDIRRADLPDGTGSAFPCSLTSTPPCPQLVITHGYDHNFVLNGSGYRLAAIAEDPNDGIVLKTFTTEPGVQLYTGNFLVGDLVGPSGHTYRQTDAFTLETQHFPDTPHHIGDPLWPSVVLNPGDTFNSTTTYKFSITEDEFAYHARF
jgi:aldose 1-epimerase